MWRNDQGAYLMNANGSERPAMVWLREYLTSVVLAVGEQHKTPGKFRLYNNYPNPFNPSTIIKYNVPKVSKVTLKVFDILGREVQTLVNNVQAPGEYSITFDAKNLASGMYLYQLKADGFMETKKFILQK